MCGRAHQARSREIPSKPEIARNQMDNSSYLAETDINVNDRIRTGILQNGLLFRRPLRVAMRFGTAQSAIPSTQKARPRAAPTRGFRLNSRPVGIGLMVPFASTRWSAIFAARARIVALFARVFRLNGFAGFAFQRVFHIDNTDAAGQRFGNDWILLRTIN